MQSQGVADFRKSGLVGSGRPVCGGLKKKKVKKALEAGTPKKKTKEDQETSGDHKIKEGKESGKEGCESKEVYGSDEGQDTQEDG